MEKIMELCERYQYPQEAKADIRRIYEQVTGRDETRELLWKAEALLFGEPKINPKDYLNIVDHAAELTGIHSYQLYLVFYLAACERLKQCYEEKGISPAIFYDTMEDLLFKARECKTVEGFYGVFCPTWYYGFFRMERFALGRLQYELCELSSDYTVGGRVLKAGTLAANCHIPSSGRPFDEAARLASYKRAWEFFRERFPDGVMPITCYSWLLFPENEKIMPEGSNIVSFMKEFAIRKVIYDEKGSDLWRIFGKHYNGELSTFPADTRMRRNYLKWLTDGNMAGQGYGIFLFDGEKMVR